MHTTTRRRRLAPALGVALCLLAACVLPTRGAAAAPSAPVGTTSAAAPLPNFSKVVTIVLENTNYDEVFGPNGTAAAPNLNALANDWALATNYYGVTHNSLPNYLALTSGQEPNWLTKLDCFSFIHCTYPTNVRHIGDQLDAAHKTWKGYMDGMQYACQHGPDWSLDLSFLYLPPFNTYATRHNPFVFYSSLTNDAARCAAHDQPYWQLDADRWNHALPDYSFIAPDLCHDGHEHACGVPAADAWVGTEVPKLLNDPDFRNGGVLFITFDEAEGSDASGCCNNSDGGHIGTIVISPMWGKRHFRSDIAANHYSLLRTVEDAWGLAPLGHAADAGAQPMREYFLPTPAAV